MEMRPKVREHAFHCLINWSLMPTLAVFLEHASIL